MWNKLNHQTKAKKEQKHNRKRNSHFPANTTEPSWERAIPRKPQEKQGKGSHRHAEEVDQRH
jgi:hypothetical protein